MSQKAYEALNAALDEKRAKELKADIIAGFSELFGRFGKDVDYELAIEPPFEPIVRVQVNGACHIWRCVEIGDIMRFTSGDCTLSFPRRP